MERQPRAFLVGPTQPHKYVMGLNSLDRPHTHSLSRNRVPLCQLLTLSSVSRQCRTSRLPPMLCRRTPTNSPRCPGLNSTIWCIRWRQIFSLFFILFYFCIYSLIVFHYSILFVLCAAAYRWESATSTPDSGWESSIGPICLSGLNLGFNMLFYCLICFDHFMELGFVCNNDFFGSMDLIIFVPFWFPREEMKKDFESVYAVDLVSIGEKGKPEWCGNDR